MYGQNIRLFRKQKGMNQHELGAAMDVSAVSVSKWEREQTQPDIETLQKLADLFDTSIDELCWPPAQAGGRDGQHERHVPRFPPDEAGGAGEVSCGRQGAVCQRVRPCRPRAERRCSRIMGCPAPRQWHIVC